MIKKREVKSSNIHKVVEKEVVEQEAAEQEAAEQEAVEQVVSDLVDYKETKIHQLEWLYNNLEKNIEISFDSHISRDND